MRPTLFHVGSIPIHSYGFLIAIGLIAGVFLAVRRGRKIGMDTGDVLDLTFYAIVVGLVGSRLLYVVMHASDYARLCAGSGRDRTWAGLLSDCAAPFKFWQGGLVFLGGAILATASSLLLARKKRLSFGDVADVLAPSVSMAHVWGRLGCFLVGCCYGQPWSGGVQFPAGSVAHADWVSQRRLAADDVLTPPLHPTQIYEAVGELCIFLALGFLWRRRPFPGSIALAYAIGYGVLRFGVELVRGDLARGFLVEVRIPAIARALGTPPSEPVLLSSAQATALLLATVAAAAYAFLAHRRFKSRLP